jgi:hypothetical protein
MVGELGASIWLVKFVGLHVSSQPFQGRW